MRRYLLWLLYRLICGFGRVLGSHPAAQPPAVVPLPSDNFYLLLQVRCAMLDMHNDLRRVKGRNLRPLVMDTRLNAVAQEHADWMAATHSVEHERPTPPYRCDEEEDGIFLPPIDLVARITNNYGFFVEGGQNLACGPNELVELMCGWKRTEKNCEVILNPGFRHCGFGLARDDANRHYWCAIYVRPYMSSMSMPDEVGLDLPEPLLADRFLAT